MTSIYGNFKNRERCKIQQTFDKEKIFVEKCGNKINCFDAIQEANIDTNIYDVMKKYHCVQDEALEIMKAKGGTEGVYLDIVELQNQIKDIGDIQRVAQQAQTMFEQLPNEIKQKYGNNLEDFFKDQEKLFKEKEKETTKTETTETKKGEETK